MNLRQRSKSLKNFTASSSVLGVSLVFIMVSIVPQLSWSVKYFISSILNHFWSGLFLFIRASNVLMVALSQGSLLHCVSKELSPSPDRNSGIALSGSSQTFTGGLSFPYFQFERPHI
jgi:hypothetical protein